MGQSLAANRGYHASRLSPGLPGSGPLWPRSTQTRRGWLSLAGLLMMWLLPQVLQAESIAIVLSSDAKPYQLLAASLEGRLSGDGYDSKILQLHELEVLKVGTGQLERQADLFVGVGTPAAQWLFNHLPHTKPLVYCLVPRPPFQVDDRAVHGVVTEVPLATQFALIREALPQARSIGMLYQDDESGRERLRYIEEQLPKNFTLQAIAVDQNSSFASALAELFKRKIDIVWTELDARIYNSASVRLLLLKSLRRRTPVFGFSAGVVRSGSLLGVSFDVEKHGEQTTDLIRGLFQPNGTDAPVQGPLRPEFFVVINPAVAQVLSIDLPESLMQRARILSD